MTLAAAAPWPRVAADAADAADAAGVTLAAGRPG
jgi:hypothetical protein